MNNPVANDSTRLIEGCVEVGIDNFTQYKFMVGAKVVPVSGATKVLEVDGVRKDKIQIKGSNALFSQNEFRWAYPWEVESNTVDHRYWNTAEKRIKLIVDELEHSNPVIKHIIKSGGSYITDWQEEKLQLMPPVDPDAMQFDSSEVHSRFLRALDVEERYSNMGNGYTASFKSEVECMIRSGEFPTTLAYDAKTIEPVFTHIAKLFTAVGHSGGSYLFHINFLNRLAGNLVAYLNDPINNNSPKLPRTSLEHFQKTELELAGGSFSDFAFIPMFQNAELVESKPFVLNLAQVELLKLALNVLSHRPMCKLLLDDAEFFKHDWGVEQNKRNGSVFRDKDKFGGKPYFLDAIIFSDNNIDSKHECFFTGGGGKSGDGSAQPVDPEKGCVTHCVYLDVKHLNLEPGYGPDGSLTQYQYIPEKGAVIAGSTLVRKWDATVWTVEAINSVDGKSEVVLSHLNQKHEKETVDLDTFYHGTGTIAGYTYPLYFVMKHESIKIEIDYPDEEEL